MSKAVYGVIDGQTRKVTKQYAVIDGVARKIKKSYAVIDGAARLFYIADKVEYTGTRSVSQINIAGKAYELHTLTSSGTLKLHADAQYWMCGGGGGGCPSAEINKSTGATTALPYSGGGGGGGYTASGSLAAGDHIILIGSGGGNQIVKYGQAGQFTGTGGNTTIGSAHVAKGGRNGGFMTELVDENTFVGGYVTVPRGGDGASGGGSGGYCVAASDLTLSYASDFPGKGEGISTRPFDIASMYPHSAGGAGGVYYFYWPNATYHSAWAGRGNGGSNGSDGNAEIAGYGTQAGAGGDRGGGNISGRNANYYGSGGAGGSLHYRYETGVIESTPDPGYGYQGVVYLLIPVT